LSSGNRRSAHPNRSRLQRPRCGPTREDLADACSPSNAPGRCALRSAPTGSKAPTSLRTPCGQVPLHLIATRCRMDAAVDSDRMSVARRSCRPDLAAAGSGEGRRRDAPAGLRIFRAAAVPPVQLVGSSERDFSNRAARNRKICDRQTSQGRRPAIVNCLRAPGSNKYHCLEF
jgi:hypothetical protein